MQNHFSTVSSSRHACHVWEISLVAGAYWMAFSRRFGTSVDWTLHLVKPTSNTTARTLGKMRYRGLPLGNAVSNRADSFAAIFYPNLLGVASSDIR